VKRESAQHKGGTVRKASDAVNRSRAKAAAVFAAAAVGKQLSCAQASSADLRIAAICGQNAVSIFLKVQVPTKLCKDYKLALEWKRYTAAHENTAAHANVAAVFAGIYASWTATPH
jgi:ABC-type nitrate/sulfonate/bicarbonate transport system substrate-binding protein